MIGQYGSDGALYEYCRFPVMPKETTTMGSETSCVDEC
jgi:hypothetical protein